MNYQNIIESYQSELIQIRHKLHQIPELGSHTPKTRNLIKQISNLKLYEYLHGLLFVYEGKNKEMILFRCEMDGLDIQENTGLAFQSSQYMHACGHDGHMACMLILMKIISQFNYNQSIGFLFQSAEESGHGAFHLIEEGLFKEHLIQTIIAFHVWPTLSKGKIGCNSNELFASSCEFKIQLKGKSAHVSQAHKGKDALKAIFEIYQQIQHIVTNPMKSQIIHIGHLQAGTIMNQVADHAFLEGTIRTFEENELKMIIQSIQRICQRYENEPFYCQVDFSLPYPVLKNNHNLVELLKEITEDQYVQIDSSLASDDFAFYSAVPSLYFLVGCQDENYRQLHDPTYYYEEHILMKTLEIELRLLEKLAILK